jgi:hypothetical protein
MGPFMHMHRLPVVGALNEYYGPMRCDACPASRTRFEQHKRQRQRQPRTCMCVYVWRLLSSKKEFTMLGSGVCLQNETSSRTLVTKERWYGLYKKAVGTER